MPCVLQHCRVMDQKRTVCLARVCQTRSKFANLFCEMRANVVKKWTSLRQLHGQCSTQPLKCHRRQVIEEKNPSVNAFVHVSPTPTSSSKDLPLSGLTVGVKDNITTRSLPTTCSSAMLRGKLRFFTPSAFLSDQL